jgi:hypothetical protein
MEVQSIKGIETVAKFSSVWAWRGDYERRCAFDHAECSQQDKIV